MWNENCFFYRDFKNYSKQMVVLCENDNLSFLPQYFYRLHFVSNRLRYNIKKTSTVLYCRFRRCLGLFSGCNKRKNLIQSQKLRCISGTVNCLYVHSYADLQAFIEKIEKL
jgi:hypothetical protein